MGTTINTGTVSALRDGDFDGLTNVGELAIEGSHLAHVPAGAFRGLNSLYLLRLRGSNVLTDLPDDMFQHLPALRTLILNNNPKLRLTPGVFDGLGLNKVSLAGTDYAETELSIVTPAVTYHRVPFEFIVRAERPLLTRVVVDYTLFGDPNGAFGALVGFTDADAAKDGQQGSVTIEAGQSEAVIPILVNAGHQSYGLDNSLTLTLDTLTVPEITGHDVEEVGVLMADPAGVTATVALAGTPITIVADQARVFEGDTATFTATRAGDTTARLTADLTLSESCPPGTSTCTKRVDVGNHVTYNKVPFAAGEATGKVAIPIPDANSRKSHPDTTLTVQVRDNDPLQIGRGNPYKATVEIWDRQRPTTVTISASRYRVTEGEPIKLGLWLGGWVGIGPTVNISVTTTGGDMLDGAPPTRVKVPDGFGWALFELATDDDTVSEADSVVTVTILAGDGYTPAPEGRTEVKVTIADND